jgi:hypothetical protein
MTEQTKQEAGKEAALADLAKIRKRPGRPPKAGTIEPIGVSLEDLEVKPKGLPSWLGVESAEGAPKGSEASSETTAPAVKRKPGRPAKGADAVPAKRRPGRPFKNTTPEVAKRGPGRPKGKPGRPRKVEANAPKRGRKPKEGGGLLAGYIKRDEAQRLAEDAAAQAVAGVYAKLPKLILKELKRLLR